MSSPLEKYPWGVIVPNPASLAALSLNRAIYLNSENKDVLVKKRDEQLLIEQSIPKRKEWVGTSGFEHFNKYVYTSGHLDDGLSVSQQNESLALISLVRDKLMPAVLFFQWMDEDNYNEVTYPHLADLGGIGLGWILPGMCKRTVTDELTAILSYSNGGVDTINKSINLVQMRDSVTKLATSAIKTLSNRLKQFNQSSKVSSGFYGAGFITSIDCLVFGYLAPVIGAPWKNTILRDILFKPENKILIHFIDDMSSKLFPEVPKPTSTGGKQSEEVSQKSKIVKNSINALIVVGILSYFVSRSSFSPLIKVHVKRIKSNWSKFLVWMYPSTKSELKGIPVYATTQSSALVEEISNYQPKKTVSPVDGGFSALG
jgi:hypothetical protein